MLNSVAAGRRQARSVVAYQGIATLAAALVFLVQGSDAAFAALLGGGAVTLGSLLMAWRAFRGGVSGAGTVLMHLFGGLALKWLVVLAVLYVALARLGLPPLPLLAGLCAALVASLAAFRIKTS